ncbi:MAG: hypothetical protein AAGM22_17160 [Acidobacteriota bacterium]
MTLTANAAPPPLARSRFAMPPAVRFFAPVMLCCLGLFVAGCEFKVSTARVAEARMSLDADGAQPTSTFSPTDVFFLAGDLANAPAGTTVSATWIAVEVDAEGVAPDFILDSTELTGASGPFHFQLSNDSPWPAGRYRVQLALDGEPERTLDFAVAAATGVPIGAQGAGVPIQTAPPAQSGGATAGVSGVPIHQAEKESLPTRRPDPDAVIASRGDHVFRRAQLDRGLEMIRFLSGEETTAAEAARLERDAVRQFEEDPVQFAEGMAFIEEVLTAARSTADVAEIAGYRMVLFNGLYALNQQLPAGERPALLEIAFAKNPVIAYDPSTQLALTARDLRSAVKIYAFGSGAALDGPGIERQIDEMARTVVPAFARLGDAEKQFLATAGVLWEVLDSNLDRFTPEQLAALRQGLAPAPPPATWSGDTMDAETARFLSQLSLQQHVSTLNVIENIGGTGNYWEVTPAW